MLRTCSPLDFRSPENYIFMPNWVMNHLKIKPYDVVSVSLVRIQLAGCVVLQPTTRAWDNLIKQNGNDPTSLLEREINKYSSLTTGSTISIEVDREVYPFVVKDVKNELGVSILGVRVQDSDVKVEIDRSLLNNL